MPKKTKKTLYQETSQTNPLSYDLPRLLREQHSRVSCPILQVPPGTRVRVTVEVMPEPKARRAQKTVDWLGEVAEGAEKRMASNPEWMRRPEYRQRPPLNNNPEAERC